MSSISDLWTKPTPSKRIQNDPAPSTFKTKLQQAAFSIKYFNIF
jgi:hypothetical protein